MIEIPARVVRTQDATAWVVAVAPTSCGACGGNGCGSSIFSRVFHGSEQEYPVDNPIAARAGENVVVGVPDGSIFKATLAAYLVPLLLLLLGAILGARFGDAAAVGGGALGLVGAYFWMRRQESAARPAILRQGESHCSSRN